MRSLLETGSSGIYDHPSEIQTWDSLENKAANDWSFGNFVIKWVQRDVGDFDENVVCWE
jgi:hypothetical protein